MATGQTLREARAAYLESQSLPEDGGYEERWVRTDIGPIPFVIPNTAGRRAIAMTHDLHHVVTGYQTDLMGEAEIGAWEIGTGITDRTAVRLCIRVFGFMRLRERERLLRAFVRGRHSKSLYGVTIDDALLSRTVQEARQDLGLLHGEPEPTREDLRAFRWLTAKGLAIVWGPSIPMAVLAWWWLA